MPELQSPEPGPASVAPEVPGAGPTHDKARPAAVETIHASEPEPTAVEAGEALPFALAGELSPAAAELEPAVAEPHQAAAAWERVEALLQENAAAVLSALKRKHALDTFRERQIDRLHRELQEHRNDLAARIAQPLAGGLIRLHDDLGRMLDTLEGADPARLTPERFVRTVRGIRDDVEVVLSQNGIQGYREAGEEFDPRRQTALRTTPTDDPTRVGRTAERLRPGFERGDRVLQKERVSVFVGPRETQPIPAPEADAGAAANPPQPTGEPG
jgi:molecular chaperone GrpE (heat shock protein)